MDECRQCRGGKECGRGDYVEMLALSQVLASDQMGVWYLSGPVATEVVEACWVGRLL